MKRTALAFSLTLGLLFAGCQPAPTPVEKAEPEAKPPQESAAASMTTTAEAKPETKPAAVSKYTPEQIAAAKELAAQLGAKIGKDAEGQVISLDMAAGRSWVDDAQMQEILVFEQLGSLTLEGPSITDALVPRIAECDKLTSLALRNTLIGDDGIAQLSGLKSLKAIDLRVAPMVTDASMQTLAAMPELRAVRLVGGNVTDAGVAVLLTLPRLTELDVRNCRGVTNKGIQQAGTKKSIRMLKIGGPKIDDSVLELVATMDNLTGLSLDNCAIADAGIAKLGRLPLVDLTIYQCTKVTDKGLEVLASYRELCDLTLSDVGANGTALAKLPHPEKLISLDMAQSRITDAEVAHLARLTNLETLDLSQTELTDAAVDTLSKLTSLKRLTLTQTKISEAGTARLRKALPKCEVRAN